MFASLLYYSYGAFMNWIGLRALSWFLVQKELWDGMDPDEVYVPRDQWKPFDPHLLAEGNCWGRES
jgi:hypothetical protein